MMANSPRSAIMASKNHMDEGISMMEKAAKKIRPIIKEVVKRLVKEKSKNKNVENNIIDDLLKSEDHEAFDEIIRNDFDTNDEFEEKLDMRAVLGYFNQNEWVNNINIGNIMQINPFSIDEFLTCHKNEYQLGRGSFLEKISLLAVGYF